MKETFIESLEILWQKDAARVAAATATVKGKADGCVECLEWPHCSISETLGLTITWDVCRDADS